MLLLAGCTSRSHSDPVFPDTTTGIDPQDLDRVAAEITKKILNSTGIVPRPGQNQVLVSASPFENRTGDAGPTSQLMPRIMNTMTQTNRFVVVSQDAGAGETATTQQGDAGPSAVAAADYTLSGTVSKLENTSGGRGQLAYIFHLTIRNTRTAEVVLTDQISITKSGRKEAIGV